MTDLNEFNRKKVYKNVSRIALHFSGEERIELDNRGEYKLFVIRIDEYSKRYSDFVELVYKSYKGVKSAEELRERCGYKSTKTFTRHFLRSMHITPKQWLISIKRADVIYYLRHTAHTFTEIATILDFSSLSHLNQFCNKQIGQNPSEIRSGSIMDV